MDSFRGQARVAAFTITPRGAQSMSWSDDLTAPIVVRRRDRSEQTLVALKDAAELLLDYYSAHPTVVVARTMQALIDASQDPTSYKIARATNATRRFFAAQGMLVTRMQRDATPDANIQPDLLAEFLERRRARSKLDVGLRRRRK